MGWGTIPDDHPLMAGMCGLQTSHRYGNATMLASRLRAGHRQPLGQPPHRLGRGLHRRAASSSTSTSSRRRSAACSRPTSASSPTPRRRSNCSSQVAREWKAAGKLQNRATLGGGMPASASAPCSARPISTRADEAAARLPVHEQRLRATTPATSARSACRRSPARSSCTCTSRATGSTAARPARWAGPSPRRSACAPPTPRARSSRCRATTTSSS